MPKLIKTYPDNPEQNRVVWKGTMDDMLFHLDATQRRLEAQAAKGNLIEFKRVNEKILETSLYKDDTKQEVHRVNYSIV